MRPDASPTQPPVSRLNKIYTRDATGLRKEAGPFDIFIYNVNNQNIALGVIFLFGGLASYPGGGFALTVLFATLLVIPIYVVYSRLSADMPRSGGDYVWVSRIMGRKAGPLLGFTVAATWIMSAFVSIGAPMAFMAQFGIAPFLRELGSATRSAALTHAGDWTYSNNGTLIVGGLFLAAFTIVMLVGVRTYMTLQRYAFMLASLGLVIGLLGLLFTGHTGFATSFDAYVKASAASMARSHWLRKRAPRQPDMPSLPRQPITPPSGRSTWCCSALPPAISAVKSASLRGLSASACSDRSSSPRSACSFSSSRFCMSVAKPFSWDSVPRTSA